MSSKSIHDGQRVQLRCKELKLSGRAFASEMAWSSSRTYRMFQQSSWLTEDLERAGNILGMNFLAVYAGEQNEQRIGLVQGLLVSAEVVFSESARRRALEELRNQTDEE